MRGPKVPTPAIAPSRAFGERGGVAVLAGGADPGAAQPRVERAIGPGDAGARGHAQGCSRKAKMSSKISYLQVSKSYLNRLGIGSRSTVSGRIFGLTQPILRSATAAA